MKFDKQQFGLHLPWFAVAVMLTAGLGGWYIFESYAESTWLGGGSLPGLACGIAAGAVIAFEMLLWPRKFFRRLRLIPAKFWLTAHIWLGLASLPLAILHTGFHWGGNLPRWLMILFIATILSGLYGLLMQHALPRLLLRLLPAETIYSQIDEVASRNLEDLRSMLVAGCGPHPSEGPSAISDQADAPNATVVVGAVRELGLVRGRTLTSQSVNTDEADRNILWSAFDELAPFLKGGAAAAPAFDIHGSLANWFGQLRRSCTDQSEPIITTMEQLCEQRRQFDLQRRMHRWLHAWLPVHVGLSVGVTVLLVTHIITAMWYR